MPMPRLAERDRERGDRLLVGLEPQLPVVDADVVDPAGRAERPRALGLGRAQPVAARRAREQVVERPS